LRRLSNHGPVGLVALNERGMRERLARAKQRRKQRRKDRYVAHDQL
jgi:hypothetical protein